MQEIGKGKDKTHDCYLVFGGYSINPMERRKGRR